MIAAVNPPVVSVKSKSRNRQEELPVTEKAILTDLNTLTVNTGDYGSDNLKKKGFDSSVYQAERKNNDILSDAIKQFQSNSKNRNSFGPLLDLHKVHDEDSLPSPTSKAMPPSPFLESAAPPKVGHALQNPGVHPYETDAVKAVSSYQQRFGRSTFLAMDRLPSPTPSEDGNDGGADDNNEEISSSIAHNSLNRNTNPSVVLQSVASSAVQTTSSTVQRLVSGTNAGIPCAVSSPSLRVPVKSRDPRLRHLNPNFGSLDLSFCPSPLVPFSASKLEPLSELMNPKKVKAAEVPILDGPALKRPRIVQENEAKVTNANPVKTVLGSTGVETSNIPGSQFASRGLLVSTNDPRKSLSSTVSTGITDISPSVTVNSTTQPVMSISGTPSLQSLLKDIAGNPAAWMNIINEQKKSSEPVQSVLHSGNLKSILGAAPLPTTAATVSPGVVQTSAGLLQVPSQPAVTVSFYVLLLRDFSINKFAFLFFVFELCSYEMLVLVFFCVDHGCMYINEV